MWRGRPRPRNAFGGEGAIPNRFSGQGSRVRRHAFQEKPESLVYDNRVTPSRRIDLARAPSPAKCLPRGRRHLGRFSGEGSRVQRHAFQKSRNRWFTITA